jgi:hypothetical protein
VFSFAWDDLLLQLEELLRPKRAPGVEGNQRPQDSREEQRGDQDPYSTVAALIGTVKCDMQLEVG